MYLRMQSEVPVKAGCARIASTDDEEGWEQGLQAIRAVAMTGYARAS
jgi:hypothetical protein